MKRIFSVRVNVDDIAASLDLWPTDQERSAWLRGFMIGLRGAPCRWQAGPEADGHAIGAAGYADSVAWRDRQAAGGRKSAETRQAQNGTSNPRANREVKREVTSQSLGSNCEVDREQKLEPIQSTNQPINGNPSTINQNNMPIPSACPFELFWNRYGKKVGKSECQTKWGSMSEADREEAIAGIPGYHALKPDPQFRVDPIRYLRRKLWLDEATTEGLPQPGYAGFVRSGPTPSDPITQEQWDEINRIEAQLANGTYTG